MSRLSLAWSILGAVLVAALLAWLTLTRTGAPGRPATTSQHSALAPFHEVEIGGTAHVTLLQGDDESLDVEASARGVRVEGAVRNGRLVIDARDRRRWWRGLFGRREGDPARITIRFRSLDAIALSGSVRLAAPKLTAASLRIRASGGSALSIEDLRANSLRVDGSGALEADLAGRVENEKVSISGAGSYRAQQLFANDVTVTVSGVGNVVLRAERTLRATISGAGVIEYVGDPAVTEHVGGIGRVKRRDTAPAAGVRARVSEAASPRRL
jgi:hypothetical protein